MAHPYHTTPYYGPYLGNVYAPQDHRYYHNEAPQAMRPAPGLLPNLQNPFSYMQTPSHLNTQRFEVNAQMASPAATPYFKAAYNPDLLQQLLPSNPPQLPPPYHPLPLYSPLNSNYSSHQAFPQVTGVSNIAHTSETKAVAEIRQMNNPSSAKIETAAVTSPQLAIENGVAATSRNSSKAGELSHNGCDGITVSSAKQAQSQNVVGRILPTDFHGGADRWLPVQGKTASPHFLEKSPTKHPTHSASENAGEENMSCKHIRPALSLYCR